MEHKQLLASLSWNINSCSHPQHFTEVLRMRVWNEMEHNELDDRANSGATAVWQTAEQLLCGKQRSNCCVANSGATAVWQTAEQLICGKHDSPNCCVANTTHRTAVWQTRPTELLCGKHDSPNCCVANTTYRTAVWQTRLTNCCVSNTTHRTAVWQTQLASRKAYTNVTCNDIKDFCL